LQYRSILKKWLGTMKIQLERKLGYCPNKLTCVVCHELFEVRKIRALLCDDHKLIQGDVCPACLKLESCDFQKKLRNQANRLIQESTGSSVHANAFQSRAVELLETSEENLKRPTIFQWLLKNIAIFAEENQELEAARFASYHQCQCTSRRSQVFKDAD
jgi:hypothetical protein